MRSSRRLILDRDKERKRERTREARYFSGHPARQNPWSQLEHARQIAVDAVARVAPLRFLCNNCRCVSRNISPLVIFYQVYPSLPRPLGINRPPRISRPPLHTPYTHTYRNTHTHLHTYVHLHVYTRIYTCSSLNFLVYLLRVQTKSRPNPELLQTCL